MIMSHCHRDQSQLPITGSLRLAECQPESHRDGHGRQPGIIESWTRAAGHDSDSESRSRAAAVDSDQGLTMAVTPPESSLSPGGDRDRHGDVLSRY
jgi:hypothetical protein